MSKSIARQRRRCAGFTLFEALVAVALLGLILGVLATVTGQWLPNWNRGLLRIQHNEQIATALDRLVADLAAAEYVSGNRTSKGPLFQGRELAVSFVRTAIGPNSRPGLDIVRIAETADRNGPVLVRMHAPFVPLPTGDLSVDPVPFGDPVVLMRAPFRVVFSYAGPKGEWQNTWDGTGGGGLPSAVRFTVRDMNAGRMLAISTATRIHVDAAAPAPEGASGSDADAAKRNPGGSGGRT